MLEIKAHHKELKRAVNEVESKRKQDRSKEESNFPLNLKAITRRKNCTK